MITGVLSYLNKQLSNGRTGDKIQFSVRDRVAMLHSLDVLAGKLSPGANSLVSSNQQQTSAVLDSNANRVHPYLKSGSSSSSPNR